MVIIINIMSALPILSVTASMLSKNKNISYQMDKKRDVISNLKFISKIKKGEKILVRDMILQPPGIFTRISRTFISPDNKENARFFVENTIRSAIDLIKLNANSDKVSDRTMCKHVIRDIQLAKQQGINNLRYTYRYDRYFICNIDTLIEEIDAQLSELLSIYSFLSEDDLSESSNE